MKRSLLIKSILEVPWVHCNGLYETNTCSYGSFIKVVTFMRAFCNLIVLKSREKCTKSRTAHSSEALLSGFHDLLRQQKKFLNYLLKLRINH